GRRRYLDLAPTVPEQQRELLTGVGSKGIPEGLGHHQTPGRINGSSHGKTLPYTLEPGVTVRSGSGLESRRLGLRPGIGRADQLIVIQPDHVSVAEGVALFHHVHLPALVAKPLG